MTIMWNAHCLNAVLQHIAAYLQLQQQKMGFLTLFAAAAASMQQYATVQHSNSENSPELLLLPQITPIYQI